MAKVFTTGVKGTDNCPYCGRTMRKRAFKFLGMPAHELLCEDEKHRAQVILREDTE